MTLIETINVGNVKLTFKLIIPPYLFLEHTITTIDGIEKSGYIRKPVYFVDVYFYGAYVFTLEAKEFTDHLNVDFNQPLNLLRARGLDHVQHSYNTDDEFGCMMQKHNLSHLLTSEPV
jgi:hypothetical protein